MIDCIIFSKDRACQLHLLLDSLAANGSGFFDTVGVIYKATTEESLDAYDMLAGEGHDVFWFNENEMVDPDAQRWGLDVRGEFKETVMQVIHSSDADYISFLVDDDIIYRPIPEHPKYVEYIMEIMQLFCFTLRLGTNTTYEGIQTKEPSSGPSDLSVVEGRTLCWDAAQIRAHTSFGYPFSVDGHIMRKKEVLQILDKYYFDTPNGLEGNYKETPTVQPMGAFIESVLVNTPLNLVGSSQNWTGEKYSVSLEDLNEKYLSGIKPDLTKMDFSAIIGCHQELKLEFQ